MRLVLIVINKLSIQSCNWWKSSMLNNKQYQSNDLIWQVVKKLLIHSTSLQWHVCIQIENTRRRCYSYWWILRWRTVISHIFQKIKMELMKMYFDIFWFFRSDLIESVISSLLCSVWRALSNRTWMTLDKSVIDQ